LSISCEIDYAGSGLIRPAAPHFAGQEAGLIKKPEDNLRVKNYQSSSIWTLHPILYDGLVCRLSATIGSGISPDLSAKVLWQTRGLLPPVRNFAFPRRLILI